MQGKRKKDDSGSKAKTDTGKTGSGAKRGDDEHHKKAHEKSTEKEKTAMDAEGGKGQHTAGDNASDALFAGPNLT